MSPTHTHAHTHGEIHIISLPISHPLIEAVQSLEGPHALVGQHVEAVHGDLAAGLDGEQLGGLDEVLDLAAVEVEARQPVELAAVHLEPVAAGAVDEVDPHLAARLGGQVVVGQEQVDAGLERVVDAGDAVRRQEQDPLVVLSRSIDVSVCRCGLQVDER